MRRRDFLKSLLGCAVVPFLSVPKDVSGSPPGVVALRPASTLDDKRGIAWHPRYIRVKTESVNAATVELQGSFDGTHFFNIR